MKLVHAQVLTFLVKETLSAKQKIVGPFFDLLFFWHIMKDFDKSNHTWKSFEIAMGAFWGSLSSNCSVSLFGSRTTIYGKSWKIWSSFSHKLHIEIHRYFDRSCNSPRSFDFRINNYPFGNNLTLRLEVWSKIILVIGPLALLQGPMISGLSLCSFVRL